MALREVNLTSGGRAWVRTELRWADYLRRQSAIAQAIPENAVKKILALRQRERDESIGIQAGPEPEIVLSPADLNEAMVIAHRGLREALRVSIARWENVRDPDDDHQLVFPDDLELLSQRDGEELSKACREALAEGTQLIAGADPNAGGGRSPSASPTPPNRAARRSTPTGRSRSSSRGSSRSKV